MTDALPLARRMMALAEVARHDPGAAYACLWTAFLHARAVIAAAGGVKANFSLRKNGTLRTRPVGTTPGLKVLKMPEVYPPRDEVATQALIRRLSPELKDHLIEHTAVAYFVSRVPRLEGRAVLQDAYHQRPTGVVDVAKTSDPRYPIWCPIDGDARRAYLAGERDPEVQTALVTQILALLTTIYANLLVSPTPDGGDANADVAAHALPLLMVLVPGALEAVGS